MKAPRRIVSVVLLVILASYMISAQSIEADYPGVRSDPLVFPPPTGREKGLIESGRTDVSDYHPLSDFGPVADPFLDEIAAKALWHRRQGDPAKAEELYAYVIWYSATNNLALTNGQLNGMLQLRAFSLSHLKRNEAAARVFDFRIAMLEDRSWRERLPARLVVHDALDDRTRAGLLAFAYRDRALERTITRDFDGAWADAGASAAEFNKIGATRDVLYTYEIFITNATLLGGYDHVPAAYDAFTKAFSGGGKQEADRMLRISGFAAQAYLKLGDIVGAYDTLNLMVKLSDLWGYKDPMVTEFRSLRDQLKPLVEAMPKRSPGSLVDFIRSGDAAAVRRILAEGADPNLTDDTNATPLMYACRSGGSIEIVRLLLEAGADPNIRGENGITALSLAGGFTSQVDIVRALLAAGADPNARSKAGWTTLMLVARNGTNPEMLRVLLEAGADPNFRTNDGVSALHLAKNSGNKEIIRLLLEAGAR